MKVEEADKTQMRELRQSGLSLEEISRITGYSTGTVHYVTKDVVVPIGLYRKNLLVGLFEGSIIDIETTGLEPDKDEIISFGFLVKEVVTVIQRMEATASEFYEAIKLKLLDLPRPLYAYNAKFEQEFLTAKIAIELDIVDIFKPWRDRADLEGYKYPPLDKLAKLPREYFKEKIVNGRDIPFLWKSYQKTKDKRKISLIVRHCMEDLIQTLYVLAHTKL